MRVVTACGQSSSEVTKFTNTMSYSNSATFYEQGEMYPLSGKMKISNFASTSSRNILKIYAGNRS